MAKGQGVSRQPDGVPADMRPETKALYDNQIALGRYSGYDDPVFLKEWGYASARQKR